jgi:hypothetical protein
LARPFVRKPLHRRSFFDRLLGRERKGNAVVEINNLLADAADVTDVSFEQVAAIAERFGARLSRGMSEQKGALFQQYLEHCLTDRVLEDTEVDRLRHLKRLLQLSDRRVSELENAATQRIYAEALEPALADRRLDDEERAFAGGETSFDFVGEVDVSGGVDEVQYVIFAVFGGVFHAHGGGFNGNAAFAFQFH